MRLIVLNSMSDDYENVDQVILRDVRQIEPGAARIEVVAAVTELVEAGLAKAYLLSAREPFCTPISGMPCIDEPEEDFQTYFYITERGKEMLLSSPQPLIDER